MDKKIDLLVKKGIRFTHPESVEIGSEVDIERISGKGVVICGGCRIYGKATCISEKAVLGEEAPVTVVDCQVGPYVKLKGGFFKEAVFLKGSSMGSGAHVREGTILEEEAGGAHTVGLKQTIIFPFVTLGSLINFCDCFMAGGTSRKDHSEVGSSYIHFNYTPYQDKATPSLIGDVPRGVMLRENPIFLGGQGGMVGPCRLAFGTVIAAGSICRKDELRTNRLILHASPKTLNTEFKRDHNLNPGRVITNNTIYIANLMALRRWYRDVRRLFITDLFSEALHAGLMEKAEMALTERIRRLKEYVLKISVPGAEGRWNGFEDTVQEMRSFPGKHKLRDAFLAALEHSMSINSKEYLPSIKGLSEKGAAAGTTWLQEIVDTAVMRLTAAIPCNHKGC